MELNDESEEKAPRAKGKAASEPAEPVEVTEGEAEEEADTEAEIEAEVASYESEIESEVAAGEATVEEEAVAREYPPPYEAPSYPIGKRDSLLKRLTPYLTVAGIVLIARIVVYSLRRRRR
jgi:hypothetical protein